MSAWGSLMSGGSSVGIRDCSDVLAERVHHHMALLFARHGQLFAALAGLRADGREFLLLFDSQFADDHVRRREYVAHILEEEGAIAYAYGSYVTAVDNPEAVKLQIAAESGARSTVSYYTLVQRSDGASAFVFSEEFDYADVDVWHPYTRLPEACVVEDESRVAEYGALWRVDRSNEGRCMWRWNVECQVPGFPFPTELAGYPIQSFVDHESNARGFGYAASYRGSTDEATLTLSVYRGDGVADLLSEEEYASLIKRELTSAADQVFRRQAMNLSEAVDFVDAGTVSFESSALRPIEVVRFRLLSGSIEQDSFLLLTTFRGHFIKVRYTFPTASDAQDRARQVWTWLANYIAILAAPN